MDNKPKNTVFSFRVNEEIADIVAAEIKKKQTTRTAWLEKFFMPKFRRLLKKNGREEKVSVLN